MVVVVGLAAAAGIDLVPCRAGEDVAANDSVDLCDKGHHHGVKQVKAAHQ